MKKTSWAAAYNQLNTAVFVGWQFWLSAGLEICQENIYAELYFKVEKQINSSATHHRHKTYLLCRHSFSGYRFLFFSIYLRGIVWRIL